MECLGQLWEPWWETSFTTVAVFLYPGNLEDEAVSFFLGWVGGQKLDLLFFRGELP